MKNFPHGDYWIVDWENTPSGPMRIHLEKKLYWDDEAGGFGYGPGIYPVTIVHSRYNGTYEGGPLGAAGWLCFPVQPWKLSDPGWAEWCGSDVECGEWWDRARAEGWPAGRGAGPDKAFLNLVMQVAARAGVAYEDLFEDPSWPVREGDDGAGGDGFREDPVL